MRERQRPRLKPIPRLLVVCEGKLTEKIYLEGARRDRKIAQELMHVRGGGLSPLDVVNLAILLQAKNKTDAASDPYGLYDQIWCVFDRDDHLNIPQARQKAAGHGFKVAFSNPCFELFLLLHFEECNKDLHRTKVASLLRKHLDGYKKAFKYEDIKQGYLQARTRAAVINGKSRIVNQINSAPYTNVSNLVDQIRKPL
ncbi:RloB family protein [Granulicella sp. S156]|uniref:RloB family protein n=1 Tax=Granulicella sp. S156 TaxID=1747224 RepID=UPI00131EB4AF|nr:RloB family protein [Granulicella sp. S156]